MKRQEIRKKVREGYGRIVKSGENCCAPADSCCGGAVPAADISKKIGYTEADLRSVPAGANLGLGCGNPIALASLKKGEVVLDLGSGAGFDCFLAAARVGPAGRVIGVDMTPDMIERARENGRKGNYRNVEFRLGEIENLPAADNSVDIIISNCVINLSPDKPQVFKEAFRVLRPGGRLAVSDMVLLKKLPAFIKNSLEAYVGCLSGAMLRDNYLKTIRAAGFREVRVLAQTSFPVEFMANDPTVQAVVKDITVPRKKIVEIAGSVLSINVQGIKPRLKSRAMTSSKR